MANINVSYQDIRAVADRLSAGRGEIDEKLRELQTAVNGLIDAGYNTDQSSVAFGEQYTEFSAGLTKAIEGLDGMSTFLYAAADALERTDAELSSAIRGTE